jgi:hypothetical protein
MVGLGVTLGVQVAVRVGPVAVGNGPYKACDVRAIDVRVLLALANRSRLDANGCRSENT